MAVQPQTTISRLASIIAFNTAIYDEYFRALELPAPSHDTETSALPKLPKEIQDARQAIIEASIELLALVQGPRDYVRSQVFDHTNMINLHAIYKYNLAVSFPVDEEASYEQISRVSNLNEPDLRRIIRYAATKHIFKEPRSGYVAHTATSRMLAESPVMMDWIGMVCEEMWPAATRVVEAMQKWPGSQEPEHTGFALAHKSEGIAFTELDKDPERSRRFASAMDFFNADEDLAPSHLLEAFCWDSVKEFVDLGGSSGATGLALLQGLPSLHCIVQDRFNVTEMAKLTVSGDLAQRVTFMTHNFFDLQPVRGADVYHFRWVFHNWSDKYCVRILRALIPALKAGARVIISDFTIPPKDAVSLYHERQVRAFDLAMMELTNSKEREAEDWSNLFREADARFRFQGIKQPASSKLSFIEAIWTEA